MSRASSSAIPGVELMTTLTKVEATPNGDLDVSVEVGKTLAVVLVGITIIVFAGLLYLNDKEAGATAFLALGEAVIIGGLAITQGETSGANKAKAELRK